MDFYFGFFSPLVLFLEEKCFSRYEATHYQKNKVKGSTRYDMKLMNGSRHCRKRIGQIVKNPCHKTYISPQLPSTGDSFIKKCLDREKHKSGWFLNDDKITVYVYEVGLLGQSSQGVNSFADGILPASSETLTSVSTGKSLILA